jgi:hypothetical protein
MCKKIMKQILLLLPLLLISACNNNIDYLGSELNNFTAAPDHPITIPRAIEISKPYLDKTFKLRIKDRENPSAEKPVVYVTIKKGWYYLVKDNHPSYTPGFYLKHAAQVNVKTGELIEPK